MFVLFRYSDGGSMEHKPDYVTKIGLVKHFMKVFEGHTIYIVADNVSDESYEMLKAYVPDESYIQRTNYRNCPGSFMHGLKWMIETLKDEDQLYMSEDDYIYVHDAPRLLHEGLNIKYADYVSGYDHPDKYINKSDGGPNPFVSDGGEPTKVIIGASNHWKYTNSCCMTFAATIKTLKEDYDTIAMFNSSSRSADFEMFLALWKKNRKLISPLPGISTHCEKQLLSPFVDWKQQYESLQ